MTDRRKQPRVPLNLPVLLTEGGESEKAHIMNIGSDGLFVRTNRRLGAGKQIQIRFTVSPEHETCTAQGAVVWQGDFGVGVDLKYVNEAFATFVKRLAIVAESERSKKEHLGRLTAEPEIEVR